MHFWEGVDGKGLFVLYWYQCPLVDFSLRELTHKTFFYALCVSGAVNTQCFVWEIFMRCISVFIHSFIHNHFSGYSKVRCVKLQSLIQSRIRLEHWRSCHWEALGTSCHRCHCEALGASCYCESLEASCHFYHCEALGASCYFCHCEALGAPLQMRSSPIVHINN